MSKSENDGQSSLKTCFKIMRCYRSICRKHGNTHSFGRIALAHKGDLDGALTDLTKAIELEPNDGYDYMIRGLFKKEKGDLDGAMADYNKAIELEPDFSGAYNNRGVLKKNKSDLDGALADYNKAIELKFHFTFTRNSLAFVIFSRSPP
jgi:tetratricopeptide (TPR) repeat protein